MKPGARQIRKAYILRVLKKKIRRILIERLCLLTSLLMGLGSIEETSLRVSQRRPLSKGASHDL